MRRVAVTGLGVISPVGIGAGGFFEALLRGQSGIRRMTPDPASATPLPVAAEVDFDPTRHFPKPRLAMLAIRRGSGVRVGAPDYMMMFIGLASAITGLACFFVYAMPG